MTSANPRQIWPWPQCQAEHMWRGLFPAAPVTVPARLLSTEGQLAGDFNTFSHPESPESNRPPRYHLPSVTYTHKHTHICCPSNLFLFCLFHVSPDFCLFYNPTLQPLHSSITETSLFSPQNLIILKYWLSCFFLLGCNIKYLSLIFSLSLSLHPSLCWHYNDWASKLLTHVVGSVFILGDSLNIGINLLCWSTTTHTLLAA